jgi:hypothetical protein
VLAHGGHAAWRRGQRPAHAAPELKDDLGAAVAGGDGGHHVDDRCLLAGPSRGPEHRPGLGEDLIDGGQGEQRAEQGPLAAGGVEAHRVGAGDLAREGLPGHPVLGHDEGIVVGTLDREPLLLALKPGQPPGRRDRAVPAGLRGAARPDPRGLPRERPAVRQPPRLDVGGRGQAAEQVDRPPHERPGRLKLGAQRAVHVRSGQVKPHAVVGQRGLVHRLQDRLEYLVVEGGVGDRAGRRAAPGVFGRVGRLAPAHAVRRLDPAEQRAEVRVLRGRLTGGPVVGEHGRHRK